jgi:hypothetical protein
MQSEPSPRDIPFKIHAATHNGAHTLQISAGRRGLEHVVPPAGEELAFDVALWARSVNVYVSRTGRSVRVFVDGEEIKAKRGGAR